jgi:hypothetical protein
LKRASALAVAFRGGKSRVGKLHTGRTVKYE